MAVAAYSLPISCASATMFTGSPISLPEFPIRIDQEVRSKLNDSTILLVSVNEFRGMYIVPTVGNVSSTRPSFALRT